MKRRNYPASEWQDTGTGERGVDGFLFSGGAGAVRPGDTGKTEDAGYYQSEQRGSGKWNFA